MAFWPFGSSPKQLSGGQVATLLAAAGFTGTDFDVSTQTGGSLIRALMITKRESNWISNNWNNNSATHDDSVGLGQINIFPGANGPNVPGSTNEAKRTWLSDPKNNVAFMWKLSNKGTNFHPWSTDPTNNGGVFTQAEVEEAKAALKSSSSAWIKFIGFLQLILSQKETDNFNLKDTAGRVYDFITKLKPSDVPSDSTVQSTLDDLKNVSKKLSDGTATSGYPAMFWSDINDLISGSVDTIIDVPDVFSSIGDIFGWIKDNILGAFGIVAGFVIIVIGLNALMRGKTPVQGLKDTSNQIEGGVTRVASRGAVGGNNPNPGPPIRVQEKRQRAPVSQETIEQEMRGQKFREGMRNAKRA